MKHAYLIIAHNEFEILQLLVQAIDDVRNDIFIHFDKKVVSYPALKTGKAGLIILNERVDVRWADVSMLEAELLLFEEANKRGPYSYYHLLSGVDLPLKSQTEIHNFFEENAGHEFIGFSQGKLNDEIEKRVQRIHLFPRSFRETEGLANLGKRVLRYGFLKAQSLLGYKRNKNIVFKRGTQWVSVTQQFVTFLLSKKHLLPKIYRNTFCSDEMFIQTACWNSSFRDKVYDPENEGRGSMRKIGWRNGELVNFKLEDFEEIMQSNMLFARKFTAEHIEVAKKILNTVYE